MTPLRIALIASARFPIREPFAGGLEAHTWLLARELRRRGHHVAVFAAPDSDPELDVEPLKVGTVELSPAARADVSMPPELWLTEHHAYLDLMLLLMAGRGRFDVVHNNSLHHLPLSMARALPMPMVTTLHTPPTPWLESALATGPCPSAFVAVSGATARSWQHLVPSATVVANGIDLEAWPPGPGGPDLVWTGRLVREKGPDLAIRAARAAGLRLHLYGPVPDRPWFEREIVPLLDDDITYGGHLPHRELVHVVGRSAAALVTPRWEEPYGLVAAEAMACGTPVAGFRAGGLPEVVGPDAGVLVDREDVAALAAAALRACTLDRDAVRAHVCGHASVARMVDGYEQAYLSALGAPAA
ncbi:glycosyltransferase family protein [Jatrophihabitans fulvus]